MWEKYLRIPSFLSISRNAVNKTIEDFKLSKGSTALDIGCGFGRITLFLNESGYVWPAKITSCCNGFAINNWKKDSEG